MPTPTRTQLLRALPAAALIIVAGTWLTTGAGASDGPSALSCVNGNTPQPGDANGDCLPDPTGPPPDPNDNPDNPIDDPPDWLLPRDALKIVGVGRTISAGRYRDVTAYCPAGFAAITGGYQLSHTSMRATKSWPAPSYGGIAEVIGWHVRAVAPVRGGSVSVYAVCAAVAP